MTLDEMLQAVHAAHLPIELPKVVPEPVDVDVTILRFLQRATRPPEPPPEPAGFSFTVTRFIQPITCTREELEAAELGPVLRFLPGPDWGWP